LINKYAVVNHRGYISGLANFFSVVGIACISAVGYVVNKNNKRIFYIKKLLKLFS
jgi:hypothetical protein